LERKRVFFPCIPSPARAAALFNGRPFAGIASKPLSLI
jgi:hypothetical protein